MKSRTLFWRWVSINPASAQQFADASSNEHSRSLDRKRGILVWLPPSLAAHSLQSADEDIGSYNARTAKRLRRRAIRIRRRRRQLIAFRLHLLLNLLDRPVELLVFAAKFFRRIVIDHDIGINAVTFDDPFFSVLGIKPEFRFEELAAVHQRKRIANSDNAAPGPLAD